MQMTGSQMLGAVNLELNSGASCAWRIETARAGRAGTGACHWVGESTGGRGLAATHCSIMHSYLVLLSELGFFRVSLAC